MIIYHNPRCRKSRETLNLIQEKGVEPEIVEYLKNPPTKAELRGILKKLNLTAMEIVRKGEAIYKENYKGKDLNEEDLLTMLVENPKLIERPIVIEGDKAVLGRPPENVLEIL